MSDKSINVKYSSYKSHELPDATQNLLSKAKSACDTAHAPYSQFFVGAAVLLESGAIHIGSNQENAAFPSGLCAERVLLNYVHANFPKDKPVALAIAARKGEAFTVEPVTPCGSCLQVMAEFEKEWGKELEVYLYGETNIIKVNGVKQFLPFLFKSEFIKG